MDNSAGARGSRIGEGNTALAAMKHWLHETKPPTKRERVLRMLMLVSVEAIKSGLTEEEFLDLARPAYKNAARLLEPLDEE